MESGQDVINTDLNYIYQNAFPEFERIAGKNLLITRRLSCPICIIME